MAVLSPPTERVFDALGSPVRREILRLVLQAPSPVGALANHFEISRVAVSKHVKILEQAQLLHLETQGRQRVATLRRDGFTRAQDYLNGFWQDVLDSFSSFMESEP